MVLKVEKTDKTDKRLKSVDQRKRKGKNERGFMNEMLKTADEVEWEKFPELKVPKICVELIGTEGTGKTHTALTFPKPAILDTEGKGWVVAKKLGVKKWFKATNFLDVIDFVNTVINDPDIETAVFDSSKDVLDMAEQFTLKQLERDQLFSTGGAVMYVHLNLKMDWIVQTLRKHGKNVVFTSRMKDDYKNGVKTGKLIRDGYKKSVYQFDFVIEFRSIIEWNDKYHIILEPVGRVLKNGYVRKGSYKPYINATDYESLIKELFEEVDRDKYMADFLKALDLDE